MAEKDTTNKVEGAIEETQATEAAEVTTDEQQGEKRSRGNNKRGRGPRRDKREKADDDGFDGVVIDVRRVSRMYKGGRRLRLSVFVAVGDREGSVGVGLGKGQDVAQAKSKAEEKAKKNLIMVNLKGNTIPHETEVKFKSSRVMLKPAAPGSGVIAGATVKAILELAGVKDILTKVLGSTNQVNVAYATIKALQDQRLTRL